MWQRKGACFTHHGARSSVLTRGPSLSLNVQTQTSGEVMRITTLTLIRQSNIAATNQYVCSDAAKANTLPKLLQL